MAVESTPGESYRVHGHYRMVKYARYLLSNYFPRHEELCWEEGRLMKDAFSGDQEALELLRRMKGRTDAFAHRFFGLDEGGEG